MDIPLERPRRICRERMPCTSEHPIATSGCSRVRRRINVAPQRVGGINELHKTLWTVILLFMHWTFPLVTAQPSLDVTIQYEIPQIGMKLVILDEKDVALDLFQQSLDLVVAAHLNDYLKATLPEYSESVHLNRESYSSVVLKSNIIHSPVEDSEENDGVRLSVVRVGFGGLGYFNYSPDAADFEAIDPNGTHGTSHMLPYIKDAFREDGGFWDLAAAIRKDELLSRTGKLQVAVGELIVGEGTLIDEEEPESESNDSRNRNIILIAIFVPLAIILLVAAAFSLRHTMRKRRWAREKQERRERAHRRRIYNSSVTGSTRSLSISDGSYSSDSWMDKRVQEKSLLPNRLSDSVDRKATRKTRRGKSRFGFFTRQKPRESPMNSITEEATGQYDEEAATAIVHQDIENGSSINIENNYPAFESFGATQSYNLLDFGESSYHPHQSSSFLNSSNSNILDRPGNGERIQESYKCSNNDKQDCYNPMEELHEDLSSTLNREDVFYLMSQEGFDTINPDEFDFDLDDSVQMDDGLDLGVQLNLEEFVGSSLEIDFASADNDDYEFRMDPKLEFA